MYHRYSQQLVAFVAITQFLLLLPHWVVLCLVGAAYLGIFS